MSVKHMLNSQFIIITKGTRSKEFHEKLKQLTRYTVLLHFFFLLNHIMSQFIFEKHGKTEDEQHS